MNKEKQINIILDFENISTKEDIFKIFKERLNYPDYFSNNWDSFYECYKDVSAEISVNIKIINLDKSKINNDDLEVFMEIIKEK